MNQTKSSKIKSRRRNDNDFEVLKLTKEENQVARYLRLKCPNKQTNLNGIKVDYFIANKLVDCLMESKFGPGTIDPPKDAFDEKKQPLLKDRHSCFKYMQKLMQKQLFTRAVKLYKDQLTDADGTPTGLRKRRIKDMNGNPESASNKSPPQPEKKEKKKFKLEIHDDQRFVDEAEPYIWTFDPTSTMSSIIGGLLILGSIAICCFPLWPSIVREGVYYLSLAGCGFLGGIIFLAVIKYIFFSLLYILSMGSVEFWLFPNLTEDVGFVESFIPIYSLKKNKTRNNIKDEEQKSKIQIEKLQESMRPSDSVNETKSDSLNRSTNELTKSTLLVNRSCEITGNTKKIQEDYDFELLDDEES